MANSNFELVQRQIEECVRSGKHKIALQQIELLVKRTKLNDTVRFHCSIWYSNLGLPQKALKILGKELGPFELTKTRYEQKRVQMRLAYMLSFFAAHKSALRIIQSLMTNQISPTNESEILWRYAGTIYFRAYQFEKALYYFEVCKKIAEKNGTYYSYLSAINQIAIADCLDALGENKLALSTIEEIKTWWPSCPAHIENLLEFSLGEYYLRGGQLDKGQSHLLEAQKTLNETTKDGAFLKKWLGVYFLLKNNPELAQQYLGLAEKILMTLEYNTTSIFEVVFWRYLNREVCAEDPAFWPVIFHPVQHPLGQMLLTKNNQAPWFHFYAKILAEKSNWQGPGKKEVCFIVNTKMHYKPYAEIGYFSHEPFIDLVSGLVRNRTNEFFELSALEYKALNFLARAGIYGVPIYMLIDLIYGDDLADPNSMFMRIEQLIKKIRNRGINIERHLNTLRLKEPLVIFVPELNHLPNPCYFLSLNPSPFSPELILKKFGLAHSKLSKLLQYHLDLNELIQIDPKTFSWPQALR